MRKLVFVETRHALDARRVRVRWMVGVVGAAGTLRNALRAGSNEHHHVVDEAAVEGSNRLYNWTLLAVVDHRGR